MVYVHCLDVKTGTVIWEKTHWTGIRSGRDVLSAFALDRRFAAVVFTGAKPGASVLALDKQTGKEVWKALMIHVSNSSPIVITSSADGS